MPAYIFDKILTQGIRSGELPARESSSREWYRTRASEIRSVQPTKIMNSDTTRLQNRLNNMSMGRMYMFFYDPKTKDKLPYYDRFPLIFPFDRVEGGFMGLNMHYLPPPLRARLMDSLYDLVNNERYDDNTRLQQLSYQRLNSASRFRFFKPCIKKYLNSHVRSRFFEVHPTEWDIALFLRTERFEKSAKRSVWAESRKIIRGR